MTMYIAVTDQCRMDANALGCTAELERFVASANNGNLLSRFDNFPPPLLKKRLSRQLRVIAYKDQDSIILARILARGSREYQDLLENPLSFPLPKERLAQATSAYAQSQEPLMIDFAKFNEANWIKARDPAVKDVGQFLQKDGYIQNYLKNEHINSHALEAGHTLRLLKDYPFKDGRIETELMLVGKAAPSIYFRTQVDNEVHKETYNLLVFDFSSPKNKHYHGLNLWKWKEKWPPEVKSHKSWVLLASWAFPVPLNEKVKIAVETDGSKIKVFFNDQLKGSVYDSDPIGEGQIGICSCEGVNKFYNVKVITK